MKIKFDSEPVYGDNDKYIKARINIYDGNVNAIFQGKAMLKKASCKCLSTIMLHSVVKVKKEYYPQIFLKECKYQMKKTKIENFVDGDLEKSLSDESDNETDNNSNDKTESDDDKDNNEPNE